MARHSNTWAYDWVYTFQGIPERVSWDQFCVDLAAIVDQGEDVYYVCGQQEEGGVTRRQHYQIFVQYRRRQRGRRIVQLLGAIPGARYARCDPHYEPRYGTVEQAVQYHTKEETRVAGPFEYGRRQPARIQSFFEDWNVQIDMVEVNNSEALIPDLFDCRDWDEFVESFYGSDVM